MRKELITLTRLLSESDNTIKRISGQVENLQIVRIRRDIIDEVKVKETETISVTIREL